MSPGLLVAADGGTAVALLVLLDVAVLAGTLGTRAATARLITAEEGAARRSSLRPTRSDAGGDDRDGRRRG